MKIKCFEDNPNKKFKLIAVNDINCNYPHRYKVIFQDIETLEKYEELLLPEQLRGFFILGNIYSKNGIEYENINIRNRLYIPKVKVNKDHSFKIRDCIKFNDNYGLNENDDFYKQNCFIYETKNFIYLIPHYVIANRYYFVSTSIKKALSKGSFEDLYYKGEKYKFIDETLYITTKKTLKEEQVPLIARMITNKTSRENFMFFYKIITHYKLKYKSINNIFIPIMMGFPFEDNESFTLKCNVLDVGHICSFDNFKTFDLRKVIMITHIIGDKIPYNFKKLHYDVYKEEKNEEIKNLNDDEAKNIPRNKPKTTGRTTSKSPSDKYTKAKDSFRVKNEHNFSDIDVEKEEIPQSSTRTIYEITDEEVDESFDRSREGSNTNKVREKLLDDELSKNSFNIDDFLILFENFVDKNAIDDYFISEIIDLENYDESSINKFFINLKKTYPRKLIYGYFIFENILINFIEVEHNIYWDKNTWYFISTQSFDEENVQTILNNYIAQNQTTKQMLKETKPIGGLKFFMTRHGGIDILNQENIDTWCKNLELGIKRSIKSKYKRE